MRMQQAVKLVVRRHIAAADEHMQVIPVTHHGMVLWPNITGHGAWSGGRKSNVSSTTSSTTHAFARCAWYPQGVSSSRCLKSVEVWTCDWYASTFEVQKLDIRLSTNLCGLQGCYKVTCTGRQCRRGSSTASLHLASCCHQLCQSTSCHTHPTHVRPMHHRMSASSSSHQGTSNA